MIHRSSLLLLRSKPEGGQLSKRSGDVNALRLDHCGQVLADCRIHGCQQIRIQLISGGPEQLVRGNQVVCFNRAARVDAVMRDMAYLVNAPVEYANAVEKLLEDTFSYRVV